MTLLSRTSAFAGLLAALLLSTPALAQMVSGAPPLTEQNNGMVLQALGQSLTLPPPDWLTPEQQSSGAVLPLVQAIFRSDETQATLEILPQGDIEALWNTLYGIQLLAGAQVPLTDLRKQVVARYARTCKPSLTAFFQLGQDDGETLAPLGFVCGAYADSTSAFAGKGEVMVMSFKKSTTGTAMVFQEWRGPAFDPATASTWPVPTATVEARAKQLQDQAVLTPSVD